MTSGVAETASRQVDINLLRKNTMRKIRIKNDINVTLSIRRDGSLEDLTGKDLAIVMQEELNKITKEEGNEY